MEVGMPNNELKNKVDVYFNNYKREVAETSKKYLMEVTFHEIRLKESIYWISDIMEKNCNIEKVLFIGESTVMDWCLNQLGIIPIEKIDVTTFELRETFPMDHEKYDLVVCTEVLEHLKDRNDTQRDIFNFSGALNLINESSRVLKRGGLFFLTTPNLSCAKAICRLILGKSPYFWIHHVREYTPAEVRYMLERANFKIEKINTIDTWANRWHTGDNPFLEFNIKWEKNESIIMNFLKENSFTTDLRDDTMFILARKH